MSTKKEIKGKIKELRKQYRELCQVEFKADMAKLFEKYPRLISFGWTQYTPYFNDGEECTFGVNRDEPSINGFDSYGDDEEGTGENLIEMCKKTTGWGVNEKPNPKFDPSAKEIVEAVSAFLQEYDEDHFKDMFGNHAQCTATRTGVDVSHYEHD